MFKLHSFGESGPSPFVELPSDHYARSWNRLNLLNIGTSSLPANIKESSYTLSALLSLPYHLIPNSPRKPSPSSQDEVLHSLYHPGFNRCLCSVGCLGPVYVNAALLREQLLTIVGGGHGWAGSTTVRQPSSQFEMLVNRVKVCFWIYLYLQQPVLLAMPSRKSGSNNYHHHHHHHHHQRGFFSHPLRQDEIW
jgi:hypothetical protein